MVKYTCKANHDNFLQPGLEVRAWCPSLQHLTENHSSNGKSSNVPAQLQEKETPHVEKITRSTVLHDQIIELTEKVKFLSEDIERKDNLINKMSDERKNLVTRICRLQNKCDEGSTEKPSTMADGIKCAVESVLNRFYSRFGPRKVGEAIADACWSVRDGVARIGIMEKARSYLRKHVFNPQSILKAMDLAGGTCNLKAYDVIRSVETLANEPYKYRGSHRNSLLPHECHVWEASKKVHQICDAVLPMKHYVTEHGECLEFCDVVKVTKMICEAFGLFSVARRRAIDLALTLDGSQLTNKLSFVMAGLKMVDPALRNPRTGEYELDHNGNSKHFSPEQKVVLPTKVMHGTRK